MNIEKKKRENKVRIVLYYFRKKLKIAFLFQKVNSISQKTRNVSSTWIYQ